MKATDLPALRLRSQLISLSSCATPHDVVRAMGAMQAQDRAAALWAVGLRLPGSTLSDVEAALAARTVVRTWPVRGTLHLVASEDVHWMLPLLTPRIVKGAAGRARQLELDDATFAKARKVLARELEGGRQQSRADLLATLEREHISTAGQRGYHILWRLSQEGLLCLGVHDDKQQTFVLLDEWVPRPKPRDAATCLAGLAVRYFSSHGPATERDLAWWSGLKLSEVRQAIETAGARIHLEDVDGVEHWHVPASGKAASRAFLLPGFDEYLLGYTDRGAVLEPKHFDKVVPGGNGMFLSMMVLDGAIVGTWKRTFKKRGVEVQYLPFSKMKKRDSELFDAAAAQYGRFLGLPATRP